MKTGTILYIEDEADDVLLLQLAMKKIELANPLRVVRSAQEGFDYLAGQAEFADRAQHPLPCLVLLSSKLSDRSGLEVLEWIRAQASLRALPVVTLHCMADPREIQCAQALGASACLVKPNNPTELCQLVEQIRDGWLL